MEAFILNDSIQIAFRIDRASREMARAFNINISDVCRKAIQAEIGLQLENNPNLLISTKTALDKYIELLEKQKEQQSKFMDNLTLVCDNLRQEKEQEEERDILKEKIIKTLKISGNQEISFERRYKHLLPEYDHYGSYNEKSINYVKELSRIHKKTVDLSLFYDAIREGIKEGA